MAMRTTNYKKIVTVLTVSFVTCAMHAVIMRPTQDDKKAVTYRYDASGNRIARGILANKSIHKSPALRNSDNIMTYRLGYSARIVQSLTQNLVHKYMKTPFFLDYDNFNKGICFNQAHKIRLHYGVIKKTICNITDSLICSNIEQLLHKSLYEFM